VSARHTLAAAVLAAAALAGCGRGGEGTTTTERSTTTRVEVLTEAAGEQGAGRFDPQAIYRREAPGVVTVISTGLRSGGRSQAGLGSGFVVSGTGEIATNAHVVTSGEGRDIRRADDVYVRFADGNQVPAQVTGFDPFSDVALLKVDPAGLRLRPLPLGSARDVQVGAPVVAIGSPFGEAQSLSVGVVSAKNRSIQSLTGFDTTGAVQTDAAINHGNSGGPLLDARGRVLGINSQIQTSTGDGSGVGFAVPVDTVRRSLAQLRADGRVRYAYLGVATVPVFPQLAERFGLRARQGAWVQSVTAGGPSADAGLRAGDGDERFQERAYTPGGDIVVALDGRPVREEDDLSRMLVEHRPGDRVALTVLRGVERREVTVTLGERPLAAPPSG
jgi:S1-C subfamily serine protease